MTVPSGPDQSGPDQSGQKRPVDVDTGFWLWVAALPLLVIGYLVDVAATPMSGPPWITYVLSGVFLLIAVAIVVTLLLLLRHGYRWARALLTGGGIASVVYATINLFGEQRPSPAAAMAYAVSTIFGSVLIVGGAYLLHRKDVHGYFTR